MLLRRTVIVLFLSVGAAAQQSAPAHASTSAGLAATLPDAPRTRLTARMALPDLHEEGVAAAPEALAGIRAKIALESPVNSKLPSGSLLRAQIKEAVVRDGQVLLPAGTLLEGHYETVHARRMLRRGAALLSFERAIVPDGSELRVAAGVVSGASGVTTDREGMLHPRLSKKRLAIQFGGVGLAAKLSDDLAEVAGGTAVGASTARFIGLGASAAFLLLQKGQEVKLKPGDVIEVEFGREGSWPIAGGGTSQRQ